MQRAVEAAGIPTVGLASVAQRVQWVRYPRAALVKFPRGANCGPPHDADFQRTVLRDVLDLLETAREPGVPAELPHRFSAAA